MKLNFRILFACAFFLTLWVTPSFSQQSSSDELETLKKEIEGLKQGQSAIQKELQEIKALLQGRRPAPAFREFVLNIKDEPFKGENEAQIAVVEFTDYQWPYCGRHVRETLPQIDKEYIATGKIKYVYLDLPLERIHKFAFKAAEASHCAGGQGKYWEMHEELFANQRALNPELLPTYAEKIGLDVLAFNKCLENGEYVSEIRKDMAVASKAGFTGTPSFGLGFTDPKNPKQVKIVGSITGAQAFNAFKANIDSLLSQVTN